MPERDPSPIFFQDEEELRAWFDANAAHEAELFVGFYKKRSGLTGISYDGAVRQALCFGWIDTTVRRIDEQRYAHRFTPRRAKSYWTAINVAKAEELIAQGLMTESGMRAFEARDRSGATRYAYETEHPLEFDAGMLARFQEHPEAFAFFEQQPPGYRRQMEHRVMSAKQAATRDRRLDRLIEASRAGKRLD